MALTLLCILASICLVVLCGQIWISGRILRELKENNGTIRAETFFREWL